VGDHKYKVRPGNETNGPSVRYVIALPGGKLADWHIRCVEHLERAGARLVGTITIREGSSRTRSVFWSIATALSKPRSLREPGGDLALPLLQSAEAVGREPIDFVLDLAGNAHNDSGARSISELARFGCWRFAFAPSPAGAPPGAGDVATGREVTEAALLSCDATGVARKVLVRGALFVERASLWRQIDSLLYEVARWPAHGCEKLDAAGSAGAGDTIADESTLFSDQTHKRGPGNAFGFVVRLVVSGASAFWRRLFFSSSLNMGVVRAPIESFVNDGPLSEIVWYPKADVQRFAADPFGLVVDGRRVVLCESLFPGHDGTIHSAAFDGSGWSADLDLSLELPFHLSYPFLLEHDGAIYCVPEASASGEIALYRAAHFPDRWEKHATLVSGVGGVDSSIVRYGEKWWMFTGEIDDGADFKLRIFHADDLFGPWLPHAANPVKIDIRSSRGGGTPFIVDGVLYRPSQDCSQTYGGRVVVNRVRALTPTEFIEEPASVVDPAADGAYRYGLHTLSRFGEYTLVDGKERYVSASWLVRTLKRPLRALRSSRRLK